MSNYKESSSNISSIGSNGQPYSYHDQATEQSTSSTYPCDCYQQGLVHAPDYIQFCRANGPSVGSDTSDWTAMQSHLLNLPAGRFFPGDERIILQSTTSPSHPYLPPVFPCGLCRREILDTDRAVQCYLGCKFWFHRVCVGVSEESFRTLISDPYAEFICEPCFANKKDTIDGGMYKLIRKEEL